MIAHAKCNGFLNAGYILKGSYVLDATATLSNTVPCL